MEKFIFSLFIILVRRGQLQEESRWSKTENGLKLVFVTVKYIREFYV